MTPSDAAHVRRRAARVLLVDERERLLLLGYRSPDTGIFFWAPVGGGIDEGEQATAAAVREVREETGHELADPGPVRYLREARFTWRGTAIEQTEQWYVAEVPHFEVSDAGWTDEEREDVAGFRWFSLADLEACADALVPRDLAAVFADLLRDGPPKTPVPLKF